LNNGSPSKRDFFTPYPTTVAPLLRKDSADPLLA